MIIEIFIAAILIVVTTYWVKNDFARVFWPKFTVERRFQHLTLAVLVVITLLWSLRAGILAGLDIHFLALTALAMMYGWKTAFVLTLPINIMLTLLGIDHTALQPSNLLISNLIPLVTSYLIFMASHRWLARNIFVFIFVCGFINGAITGSLHLAISAAYLSLTEQYHWQVIYDNYLIFIVLMLFPEGLLNGMALAMLSVFKPEWLRVFSDRDYIYHHSQKD
ncbi:Uncharacterized membrane protein [Vibrio xiamenensis]|uniref:Uncharacterized membrane protein n=1 Tax=Vibrio xiamenensis TaxID=861298 RepID=A0A1G7WQH1_9VIBR|nr:energy-coupling factor ABC transporter permease [Vibrio xiamenensis]SDG74156.1 Uncharacterized membrane protein [Vibrio xiamenensis]